MNKSNIDDFEVLDIGNQSKELEDLKNIIQEKENDINSLKELLEQRNQEISTLKKDLMVSKIKQNDSQEESKLQTQFLQEDNQNLLKEIQQLQKDLDSTKFINTENQNKIQKYEYQVQNLKEEIKDLKSICQAMDQSKIGFKDQKLTNLENEIENLQSLLNEVDADTYTQIILEKVRTDNKGKSQQVVKDQMKLKLKTELDRMKDILDQNGVKVKFEFL